VSGTATEIPQTVTAPADSGPARAAWWRAEWTVYAAAGLLASFVTYVSLRLWHLVLTVPILYTGDALPMAAHVKTVLKEGWFQYEPNLGAPTGELYFDFPQADNFHLIGIKVIGWFVPDWPAAMNIYYLIGFPLAALAAVWFLRVVGVSRVLAILLSVVYAIAPYHFIRGEAHLYLASYYPVPLALVLLVWVLRGEPLWGVRPDVPRWWGVLSGRGAAVFLILALLGTASQYYSLFFLILLAFAGVVTLIRRKEWRRFWGAATAGVVTVVVLVINALPGVIYGLIHGPSIDTLQRGASESEIYGLKLSQLLLPWNEHLIPALRNLRIRYDQQYPLPSESPALGIIAACGLVAAFLVLAYVGVAWRSLAARPWAGERWFQTLSQLSSLLFVAFLFGTIGGLSTFVSFFTSAVRGWNRISIVMAMLCLAVIGLLLDRAIRGIARRLARRRPERAGVARGVLAAVVAATLLVVGFVDQTPYDASSALIRSKQDFRADQQFFSALEKHIPKNGMVLQLPYIGFPEDSSPNGVLSSDELVPFLQTDHVRWTSGGIKGRPAADWPEQLEQYEPSDLVALAAAADMDGILVDSHAYADGGTAILTGLEKALGERPIVSPGNLRWHYFDLKAERVRLDEIFTADDLRAVGKEITNPTMPYVAPDFSATVTADGTVGATSSAPGPQMTLQNPGTTSTRGQFLITVSNGTPHGTVTISGGGIDVTEPIVSDAHGGSAAQFRVPMSVSAGRSYITVTSQIDGAPVPGLLTGVRFIADDVSAFLERAHPVPSTP
jgi:hypothetical protein